MAALLRGTPRYIVHQGGTRSGKSYNICIALVAYLCATPGLMASIVRATGPALKATVYRDLVEILEALGLYSEDRHSKTDQVITLPSGSRLEYFSADDGQKLRGRKRHILWVNETNELDHERFRQLNLRTSGQVIMDFNPSMLEHWIWDTLEGHDRAAWYYSTYKDNLPFLAEEQVREIEALQYADPWAWQVYGLGRRGASPATIYQGVEIGQVYPDLPSVLGLDFGYNDPMVLSRIARQDTELKPTLHVKTLLHESYLTTDDLLARLPGLGVRRGYDTIYCDAAEPDRIVTLQRAGYAAKPADKGPGSVKAGIDFCKAHRIIHYGLPQGASEIRAYRWREDVRTSRVLDEPSHVSSHTPDAMRYAAYTHWSRPPLWLLS